jgi:predicted TIM-barrel fold metal-dependent hydrolase
VFGPASRYAYNPNRAYTPPDALLPDWFAMHQALGLDRGVLTQPSVYGTDNACILDAIAANPDRLRGVAAVPADVSDDELARLDDGGIRGLRLNVVDKGGMPFDSFDPVKRIADRIAPLGWHIELLIQVHRYPDLDRLFDGLSVNLVFGHLGYVPVAEGTGAEGFQAFLRMLRGGHAWVKLTGPYRITAMQYTPYTDVAPFAAALLDARPDRIVWGSDWPHPFCQIPMPNDGDLIDHLIEWIPDPAQREQVLVDNPQRLYGF